MRAGAWTSSEALGYLRVMMSRRNGRLAAFGVALACACGTQSTSTPQTQHQIATPQDGGVRADAKSAATHVDDVAAAGQAGATVSDGGNPPGFDGGMLTSAEAGGATAGSGTAGSATGSGGGSPADREAAGNPGDATPAAGQAAEQAPQEPGDMGPKDSDGCPTTLEGFATLSAEGQNGTSGGVSGETITVANQDDLERYAGAAEPYVIRVQGALKIAPKGKEIEVGSNKTIIGVGDAAQIVEGGFVLREGMHNVIIRNLTIYGTFVEGDWEGKTQDYDGVQMDTAHHVWIDHCHFHHIGDGIIDSRKDTSFLTVSWNILSDHNKAFGIGWTDNVTAQITVHHNWLRDTNQRNPSTDNVLRAHLYNNWLQRVSSYGNYARGGTHMVLENSVFDTVKDPHYYDTGSLVAIDNVYVNTSGKRTSTGTRYEAFDPHDHYMYELTPASEVTALLARCAGPRPTLGQ